MEVIKARTVEDVLKEGPPLEWYWGLGRTNLGITDIHYSNACHRAFGGELMCQFGQWQHIGVVPRVFGIKAGQEEEFTPLIEEMHECARKTFEISGFWPEEIEEKKQAVLLLFRGQYIAPFEVILVDPLS